MKQKIYINSEETLHSLMEKGLSKATAWRALKRGYYWINYHQKEIKPIESGKWSEIFTSGEIIDICQKVIAKYYGYSHPLYDEMVGEAILRLCELSGHKGINSPHWRKAVILNATKTLLQKFHWKDELINEMIVGFKHRIEKEEVK
jgi:hypothetical protein